MHKISYTERCSQIIQKVIDEHQGLENFRVVGASTYDDCNATIFFGCNDRHQSMMSVKSVRSANIILKKLKK